MIVVPSRSEIAMELMDRAAAGALAANSMEDTLGALLPFASNELSANVAQVLRLDNEGKPEKVLAEYHARVQASAQIDMSALDVVLQEWSVQRPRLVWWVQPVEGIDGSPHCCLVHLAQAIDAAPIVVLFFACCRRDISWLAETFLGWMSVTVAAAEKTALAEMSRNAASAAPRDRDAKHRINNALGAIAMHADLGEMLTRQTNPTTSNRLFGEISEQVQECAQAMRELGRKT